MNTLDRIITKLTLLGDTRKVLRISDKAFIIEDGSQVEKNPTIFDDCIFNLYNIVTYNIENNTINIKHYQILSYNIESGLAIGISNDKAVVLDADLIKIADIELNDTKYDVNNIYTVIKDYVVVKEKDLFTLYDYINGRLIDEEYHECNSFCTYAHGIILTNSRMDRNRNHTIIWLDGCNERKIKLPWNHRIQYYGRFRCEDTIIEGMVVEYYAEEEYYAYKGSSLYYILTIELEKIAIDISDIRCEFRSERNLKLITTKKVKERYDRVKEYVTNRGLGNTKLTNYTHHKRTKNVFYDRDTLYYEDGE